MRLIIFLLLFVPAIAFFIQTIAGMARAASRGREDIRPRLDQIPARIASVLIYFIGQKKVAEEGPLHMTSKHHLLIFWGFLIITAGTVEMMISGIIPSFSFGLVMPDFAYDGLRATIDVANLVVLLMVSYAFFRRIVIKPHLIPMNLDAGLILGGIGCLMLSHFLYHAFHIQADPSAYAPPVSGALAKAFGSISVADAKFGSDAAYWIHVAILLIFLNYLPFSKHIHLLGALPNIFLRNLSDRRMDLPRLDLEDENQWGVGRFEQFSWKSLVDTYACTECARCTNYCPAYATDKNLSPMQLIHDIRYEMIDRDSIYTELDPLKALRAEYPADDTSVETAALDKQISALDKQLEDMQPMTGGRIAEDTLWACTSCGACQEVCPVFIEHPAKIIQMRQNLVLEQEAVPGELARTYRNMERQSNPWGSSNDDRMKWAQGHNVPTIDENTNPEYILWVGCAGAFDPRIQKQTLALVKVLNAAQVDYAVLGAKEKCTGDTARRTGNEMLFEELATTNIETLNDANAKKVVTSCPHCLHTIKHDYPQFGGNYEVIHHTQLISHLLTKRKLEVPQAKLGRVTYHDSCYLGRWNGEFDAPRDIIDRTTEGELVELERNKQHGFCCGAGGGRMWMEEEGPRVNNNRTKEIIDTEADTVAVACPFCTIMITDGLKAENKEEDIAVLDIAEVVANSIDVPLSSLTRKP